GRPARGGAVDQDHVLATISGESSDTVPEAQSFGRLGGLCRRLRRKRARRLLWRQWGGHSRTKAQLSSQGSAASGEHSPRGGSKQERIFGRHRGGSQHEHTAWLAKHLADNSGLQLTAKLLGTFRTLIQNHEIRFEPPAAGIRLPLKKLPHEDLVFGCGDVDQHDRQVTGNGMGPQPRLSETVRGNSVWLSQLRIREN